MDHRDQRIGELEAKVAEQAAEIAELKTLVAALTGQLGRTSRNSHLPPSSDGPGARSSDGKKPNKAGKRKRGGQKGHRGHKRDLLPVERVDHVVDLFPEQCENCWSDLPKTEDPKATRYQTTELPPVRPETTEYRRHSVKCDCGHTTSAKVEGVVPVSPFGPRLMSLVALFTGVYHLSRRQTASVLHDVLGVRISLGAISAVEARVSKAVESPVQAAHAEVERAAIKHADATSWLQSGNLRSLWTIATATATVFKIVVNGAADTIKPFFGACQGILVSDRATVFSFWPMKRRQICWAHLLRKFISFSERDGPAGQFGKDLLDYTALVFKYWQNFRDGEVGRKKLKELMAPVRTQVEDCLRRAVANDTPKLSGSCSDILAHQEALWTFIDRDGVEPTNNHAERELRAFVLWRRRSFGTQSDRGNLFAERVMTVAHTARKQDKNVLAFLTACCEAKLSGSSTPSLFAGEPTTAA